MRTLLSSQPELVEYLLIEAPVGLYVGDERGRCRFVNRAFSLLTGLSPSEALGDGYLRVIHPDDRERLFQEWDRAIASNGQFRCEYRMIHALTGRTTWIDGRATAVIDPATQRISAYVGCIIDVTERHGMSEALLQSNNFLDSIVEHLPLMLFIKDARDLRFVRFNKAGLDLLGYSAEDLIGKNDYDFFPPDQAAFFTQKDREVLRAGEMSVIEEEPIETRTKGRRILRTRKIPLPGDDVSPGYLLGISEDITDVVHTHEAAEKARRAAEEATKLKSQFLANMSHEIRTPMNGILGMTALVLETQLTAEQREYLETVQSSARALLRVLGDILDYSKIEAGKLELVAKPFSLNQTLHDFQLLFSPSAEAKRVSLKIDPVGDIPDTLIGDEGRIRQVLTNLLGNALKFTPKGGKVELNTVVESRGEGRVTLRFTVRDTGIGIPADKHKAIFEPFRQADASITRRHGGTGLGLSISAQLVALMGGVISLTSQLGRGSVFDVVLTLEEASPQPQADDALTTAQREISKATPGLRVLLAEDNPVNQRLAIALLQKSGCVVTLAKNGREALDFRTRGGFDVILMDVEMPILDGVTATKLIREFERDTGEPRMPVVALTAHSMHGDRERFLAAGMDDYLSKPFTREGLEEKLSSIPHADAPDSAPEK